MSGSAASKADGLPISSDVIDNNGSATVLKKRKREETVEDDGRIVEWHPRYKADEGPDVILESADGCLFKVRRSQLTAHSSMFDKWLAGMKSDWILNLGTDKEVVALLLDLMVTPSNIASMADLEDRVVVKADHAARSYGITTLYPIIDKRMGTLLALRPFEIFKIASDLDMLQLGRRAIKHMSAVAIMDHCGISEKRDAFIDSLQPAWQIPFYRMLLQGNTKSCRRLESEIRSIVSLDADVFQPKESDKQDYNTGMAHDTSEEVEGVGVNRVKRATIV